LSTAADPSGVRVVKRSVLVAGHATSASVEEPFWDGLRQMAQARGISLNALIAAIDGERRTANLSSAIRLAVLDHYRALARGDGGSGQGASG
jgi:predicted DNA-binding ribbon-helix-helix protein